MRRFRIISLCVLACGLLLSAPFPKSGQAEELARKFLDGLRERALADMALEYLDRMEKSPLCPPELKKDLQYERGVTLILAGRLEQDPALQETKLNDAQQTLQEYIKRNPTGPLTESATDQLGNVLLERARGKIEQADRPKNADKRDSLLEQGRTFYDQAHDVFQKRLDGIKRELLDPKYKNVDAEKESELAEQRDALRGAYVQSQLMSATVLRTKAETYPAGSAQYKQGLQAAAEAYDDVYKKYRTRIAGLYARLYQARCYQQLGGDENHKEAVTIYSELLEQPYDATPLRNLRTQVIRMSLECWLEAPEAERKKPDYYKPAIAVSLDWEKKAGPGDDQDPEWLGLRYWLAKVLQADADSRDDKDRQKGLDVKEATRLARHVAKYPGDFKKDAQTLLQELLGGKVGSETVQIEPQDFAEARSAGREALEQVQLLKFNLDKVTAQAKTATGQKKQELNEQLKQLQENLAKQQESAVKYFRLALALADEDVSLNDKNIIHYFLCYLYYLEGSYYNSAVVGEFLARHFPAATGARPCAKIAMASYLKLYKADQGEDKDFEIGRIVGVADYIVRKWPTQPEAQEALSTLIPFMIRLQRLDDAEGYLQQIDPSLPRRGEAELQTGQAMWSKYLLGTQAIRDADKAEAAGETVDRASLPKAEDLTELRTRAQKTLADGIARMKQAAVDRTLALAALSLAQVYVDTQQPQKAVELIEDENIGPKTLVEKEHEAAKELAYKVEAYKVALRAYIGALPDAPAGQAQILMNKAEGVMNALKKLMGGTPEGQRRLVGIYISLATDIQKQIDNADQNQKAALINGFEVFLSRVGDATKDVKELFWVAQTFYGLGESSDTNPTTLLPEAKRFYEKAVDAYNKILALRETDKEVTPDMVMQIQMRLATTKRRLQQYKEAIDLFEQILLAKNMMLNVQVEAARTYQDWGRIGEPVVYDRAVMGGRTNEATGKYTIWGWSRIAKQTTPDKSDQYVDVFFEARYNQAQCRLNQGKRATAAKEREEFFGLAKNDIQLTYRLYPDMGNGAWTAKFDGLLKQIQQQLKEPATGLAGLSEYKEGPELLKSEKAPPKKPEEVADRSEGS